MNVIYFVPIIDFRWGFVTHGCIDGYSRLIIYLQCATSISGETVLNIFTENVVKYGLPSRIRSDHGYENFFVAVLMNTIRGYSRGSHITGRSVHNQRIERLWRDVFQQVISYFYNTFCSLESESLLNIENAAHLYVLHSVYLIEINKQLKMFVRAWNKHGIRTENERTPQQLWLSGMLENMHTTYSGVEEIFNDQSDLLTRILEALSHLGININEVITLANNTFVPAANINITNTQRAALTNIVESEIPAKDKYLRGVQLFNQ